MDRIKLFLKPFWERYWIESILISLALIGTLISGILFFKLQSTTHPSSLQITAQPSQTQHTISVHIDGAVVKPGVYQFPAYTRLHEVLAKAQGLSPQADSILVAKNINLSKFVEDQEKIYIPFREESSTEPLSKNNDSDLISINSASESELETLPGIGPTSAGRIIEGRPYTSLDQLVKEKIIYQTVFEKIKSQISL